ncbi:MAG: hypothetical protein IJ680_07340, partial [Paludibacteraceae bacterium]|nr:hypothetical protein [Paludibacteraceae bacterium]
MVATVSIRSQQAASTTTGSSNSLPVIHPPIGLVAASPDSSIVIRLIGKKQHYSYDTVTYDADIHSPKSVNIHPDGKKYYVNSLEGCRTVSYDMATGKKLHVTRHKFSEGH